MRKEREVASNTAYTIGGALLMNGILQLLVYPLLNRYMGSEQLGNLLYIMGLVAVICPSVGQALNTSRLVVRRNFDVKNGDYNKLLLLFGGAGACLGLLIARASVGSVSGGILTVFLLLLTAFRYYGDVEYRLSLNYRQYFIYYAVLSAGYLVGFGLYLLSGIWFLVFVTGEAAALIYLAVTGSVFRKFWQGSAFFSVALRRGSFLVGSYLITNLTMNIDRIVLKNMIGDLAVTQYYVTSLIGKTLVLLVAPVNTIIISYLTRRKENLNRRQFLRYVLLGLGVCVLFFLFAQIATPIFVRLFYGDALYQSVRGIVTIVNLSQILGVFSAFLFIVVLTFTAERWQLILQAAHLVVLGVLVILVTPQYGIVGFSVAVLAANTLRVLAVIVLGIIKAGGKMTPADSSQV